MSDMVNLTIDGRTVTVPKGTLLIEAARSAGISIPYFCYHPKLDPAGVCRMCLVQIEKIPKPQTACTTYVGEGMVVHTQNNSEVAAELQKGVLEFLLVNHPLDCPVCDKGGECDLQDLTFKHGPSTSRLQDAKVQKDKSVDLGNFIVLDNERCILCRRCTRFDEQIATEGNLIVEERGHHNYITTLEGERYDSYFSGNTIELCPVGALTSELYRFKARPWDLAKVESVCTSCSVGCNVNQEYRHGQLLRLTAQDNPEVDNGWLCDRGRFNYKFVQSENRITKPMIKKNGSFETVTWSEALAYVAEKLGQVKGKVGVIGGGKLTNEEAYLLQKFARVALSTNNVDHRVDSQIITSLGIFAGRQSDINKANTILVLDTNPAETAPVMDLRIRRQLTRHKAKLAIVGNQAPKYPGRNPFVATKPGQTASTVAELAKAVSGVKIQDESLKKVADTLAAGTKIVIVWGGDDAATGRALIDLANALRGSRQVTVLIPGAQNNSRGAEAMGVLPTLLTGYGALNDSGARQHMGKNLPTQTGLSTGEMLKAAASGELKALYLAGANLLNTYPNRKVAEEALRSAFVVTTEVYLTETAELADVILPAAVMGEKSGTYTNLDGLVQPVKQAKKAEGSAQADGDILVALAQAMGVKLASSPSETVKEIERIFTKLEPGTVLKGAPTSLIPNVETTAQVVDGLLLVPVTRLYAGGSTAKFDEEFSHVQPKAQAIFNPADARKLGLKVGEQVELTANGGGIVLEVTTNKAVVPGTVQAIRGLTSAPVNKLTGAGGPVAVTVAKLSVEVAD